MICSTWLSWLRVVSPYPNEAYLREKKGGRWRQVERGGWEHVWLPWHVRVVSPLCCGESPLLSPLCGESPLLWSVLSVVSPLCCGESPLLCSVLYVTLMVTCKWSLVSPLCGSHHGHVQVVTGQSSLWLSLMSGHVRVVSPLYGQCVSGHSSLSVASHLSLAPRGAW